MIGHLFNRIEGEILFCPIDPGICDHRDPDDDRKFFSEQFVRDPIPFHHPRNVTLDILFVLNPHPFLGLGKQKFCNADIESVAKKTDGSQRQILFATYRLEVGPIAEFFTF